MQFAEIQEGDSRYIMHAYGRFPAALVKGKNATAWDTKGKKYIDFTSGIGVNCLGYSDPQWAAAVAAQAAQIQHLSNLYYSPVTVKAAKALCEAAGMQRVFFGNSGAEANECAIKIARKYSADKYGEGRSQVVTLQNSFHGRTVTTLAATGQRVFHEKFLPLTEGFAYAEPKMESVRGAVNAHTCAVLIELIQGEGGVHPMEKQFVQDLAAFCAQKDLLLLIDEVQTGIGRTGSFFCYQQYGITPDVVSAAKALGGGLPIGACLVGSKCAQVFAPGDHGSTFGGNPVVCAGALEVLSRVAQPAFLEDVRKKGAYLRSELEKLPNVESVRGLGMMLGAKPAAGEPGKIAAACVDAGLLVLTAKDVLRFLPPLTISKAEMDEGLAILRQVLQGFAG
ncbi:MULTISPECIES: aspartate aminotransferase family protein [Caproicibacterium]|uniref:Acetylornithine aminotransferase n=1 Tax=Caproicibacterium argilliputei TaxID=3030016 RepID=A0AA97DAP1_9FIRM|nr:aspartate aminotransferase family protein [Caproicibacterium argilliputei]WOC32140.1 aspartate aminotransferase family protein [Caproicibacterium argilliputei]